ncbi:MAG TPA: PPC domain-containing protein [Planctomycetota bacterium]|nr:PPC domain-containing protein [Planctomycetota bacterium]
MSSLTAALLLTAGFGSWQAPQVDRLAPMGGHRGTEVSVTLTGQRLFDPQDLMPSRPGIEVLDVAGDKPERCTARLWLEPECPLGPHALRLRTATGISNLVLFEVGALPEIAEQREGNAVQTVPLECTIDGDLRAEQVDRYAVQLTAGTLVRCEVEGMRLGVKAIDLALSVLDPNGFEVVRADDTVLGIKDPMLSFVAIEDGTHVVQVQGAYADDVNTGAYRLHLGGFPQPTGCLPCGGRPGELLTVTLLGDAPPGAATTARVQLPDDGEELFRFYAEDERGIAPTPILLRVGGPPNREPTLDEKKRAWVEFPASVHGVITGSEPVARFWFRAKKGDEIEFRCVARSLRSPLDPTLILRQADGRFLAYNDDSRGPDSVLRFKPAADGEFQIEVRDLLRRGGPDCFFRLEGEPPNDASTLRMVVGRNDEPVIAVPRGNRAGAVLQWSGLDGKQQLALLARGLPAGVTASFGPVQSGTNLVPLVLTAAADAQTSGNQIAFALRDATRGDVRDLDYAQYVPLVTVRNNLPLLGTTLHELPVAVVQPAPFTLHLDAPAVPIVRGAPLALRVHVVRADGFTEPVRVRSLWTTPGLGAGQVVVDGKSDSGELPLSANGGAMTGRFPIAVVGEARQRGGSVEAYSDFVDLQVDEPWLTADVGRARTEPGTGAELRIALAPKRPFTGTSRATLLGLPRGVRSEPITFLPEDRELRFVLQVTADAPPGRHRGFLVQLLVPAGDGAAPAAAVEHRFGGGEIRIDTKVAPIGEAKR